MLVETTAATFTTAATLVAMGGGICLVAATRGKHRRQGTHISWKRQYQNITVSIDRILYHKRSGIIDKRGLGSLMYAMVVSSLYACLVFDSGQGFKRKKNIPLHESHKVTNKSTRH